MQADGGRRKSKPRPDSGQRISTRKAWNEWWEQRREFLRLVPESGARPSASSAPGQRVCLPASFAGGRWVRPAQRLFCRVQALQRVKEFRPTRRVFGMTAPAPCWNGSTDVHFSRSRHAARLSRSPWPEPRPVCCSRHDRRSMCGRGAATHLADVNIYCYVWTLT